MAGGVFPGYPFEPNWKCVWFTAIIAGGYWVLPPKSLWVLFLLLILPYVAMAWYDYAYDCKNKLKPTLVPFGRTLFLPLKPPEYQQEFEDMKRNHPEAIEAMDRLDHVSLWIVLVAIVFWGARLLF